MDGSTAQPGIHLTPRLNESPLRETSSGGIGIDIAGDSSLVQAGQNLTSSVRFPTVIRSVLGVRPSRVVPARWEMGK